MDDVDTGSCPSRDVRDAHQVEHRPARSGRSAPSSSSLSTRSRPPRPASRRRSSRRRQVSCGAVASVALRPRSLALLRTPARTSRSPFVITAARSWAVRSRTVRVHERDVRNGDLQDERLDAACSGGESEYRGDEEVHVRRRVGPTRTRTDGPRPRRAAHAPGAVGREGQQNSVRELRRRDRRGGPPSPGRSGRAAARSTRRCRRSRRTGRRHRRPCDDARPGRPNMDVNSGHVRHQHRLGRRTLAGTRPGTR